MKNCNQILKLLSVLVVVVAFTSCKKEYVPAVVGTISYEADMQPFFDSKCIKCHNGSSIPLNLQAPDSYNNLNTGGYIDVATPTNSKLYQKLSGGSMEVNSTSSLTAMTLLWIEQGALNN
tara:strand:- start:12209 stop:12568 length:360 start_codon:yes stop_codon:yes gene_type:complete